MKFLAKFILPFAVFTALVSSSPLPQEPPAPGPAPPSGGEKKIVVVGPGPGPWSVGSEQVATWWSTGFTSDDPITVTTHEESGTTPIFSADSTLNKGSTQIPIDDKYTPGTNYVTEVSLKSDPSIKGIGPAFTVTGGGGGGEPKAAPGPPPPPGGPSGGPPPPDAAGGKAPEPSGKGPEPSGKGPEPSGKEPEPSGKGPEPSGKEPEVPGGPPPPPDAGGPPPPDSPKAK
ncbi:unnamed protein product [Rhizophagus irregularis]|uniref:Uncharacterized protein n=1 Tax=Rhizophagus irregularis TaxID=588596 RepID=A0A2N1MV50_9GLOM|nr:hypothetical protein RhiirC2_715517 [Rhizophagus irregularis]CAB4390331.1 unnamed protein product [Rhizophagus irregularis]CAB5395517.1 unnamed protein product [Rhizophagus irregularis]